ncbi:MAG: hypothetical protein LUH23_09565 [Oscillospiraceae bacterium]|nr:hypothetical protein [Oscillospiraceae bacterium]
MKKLLATVLCVVLLAGLCVIPVFAYGSDATTLGEFLSEYDYTAEELSYEISTWFYQNTNSSFYDLRSDNAEAQLEGTYYAVSDISGVIEILLEDSESEFEDVYHRDDNGDVTVVEQSEDYYSWGSERILIRTTDGSLPRLIIFLDSSGGSYLFCWETGKGCKLSDSAYYSIKEVLGIDNLSGEDAMTYSYYPLPEGSDDYVDVESEGIDIDTTENEDWFSGDNDENGELLDIDTSIYDEDTDVAVWDESEENSNPETGIILPALYITLAIGSLAFSKKRN